MTTSLDCNAHVAPPSRSRMALKHREDDLHRGWKNPTNVSHITNGESHATPYTTCSTISGFLQTRMYNAHTRDMQYTQIDWIQKCLPLPITMLHPWWMCPLCSSGKWTFALR